jgi:hypothetical protein
MISLFREIDIISSVRRLKAVDLIGGIRDEG